MTQPVQKAQLIFPLFSLPEPEPEPEPVVRLLHLDAPQDNGLGTWVDHVRGAAEACLVIDAEGRIGAMSEECGALLSLDPVLSVGSLLLDLVDMVDFSAAGVPVADPEVQAPPLRALSSGRLTRGLVRLRNAQADLTTYDVVGVPLENGVGALGFLTRV